MGQLIQLSLKQQRPRKAASRGCGSLKKLRNKASARFEREAISHAKGTDKKWTDVEILGGTSELHRNISVWGRGRER